MPPLCPFCHDSNSTLTPEGDLRPCPTCGLWRPRTPPADAAPDFEPDDLTPERCVQLQHGWPADRYTVADTLDPDPTEEPAPARPPASRVPLVESLIAHANTLYYELTQARRQLAVVQAERDLLRLRLARAPQAN